MTVAPTRSASDERKVTAMDHWRRAGARVRKGLVVALGTGVLVPTLAACFMADPLKTTPDVALGVEADGSVVLLGNLCHTRLASIEIGGGGQPYVNRTAVITPTAETRNRFVVNLGPPGPAFEVTSGSAPLPLAMPAWVIVRTPDGVWADATFDRLPEPGQVLALPYGATDGQVVAEPISDFPTQSPYCGSA